ncbi:PASTA domain-containing protein [Clavibacter tessellarius]|uniref:PASTA domain-containing protein n=2 Tax=Microbacteriaceae TaxID=85023 RepID=UPI00324C50F5
MSPADAQSAIEGAGLSFAQGGARASSSVPAGQVAGSDPGAGANAARGSTVTVFTSSGPDQSQQQQGTPGTVPDVRGQDMTSARQTLRSAGFNVTMAQEQVQDNSQIGKATRTDPAAGQQSGGPVTLYIGRT